MTKKHHHHKKHRENPHHPNDKEKHSSDHRSKDHHHHHHRKHKRKTIGNPIIKAVLEGVYEDECVLSKLRGCPHLLKDIWTDVRMFCLSQITLPNKEGSKDSMKNQVDLEDEGMIQSKFLRIEQIPNFKYKSSDL